MDCEDTSYISLQVSTHAIQISPGCLTKCIVVQGEDGEEEPHSMTDSHLLHARRAIAPCVEGVKESGLMNKPVRGTARGNLLGTWERML